MELKFGQIVQNILDNGGIIKLMEKEFYIMRMEMCMKDSGLMIRQAGREFIPMEMELNTLDNGKTINRMDLVKRNGQMEKYIKDSTVSAQKMERDY